MSRIQGPLGALAFAVTVAFALVPGGEARGASPREGTLSRAHTIRWTGSFDLGGANLLDECDGDAALWGAPPTACDGFVLHVRPARVPPRTIPHLDLRLLAVEPSTADIDLALYHRNADGSRGGFVDGSFQNGNNENVSIPVTAGDYIVAAIAYTAQPETSYSASATLRFPAAPAAPKQLFGRPSAALRGCPYFGPTGLRSCFEPTVAVDPRGRIFVSSVAGADIARSTDGGRTFARIPVPPPPLPAAIVGDSLLQVDPRGRLFYSTLVAAVSSYGIQVARSSDGGTTWESNTMVGLPAGNGIMSFGSDRQWLAFGSGETVYMTYKQLPPVWLSTSVGLIPPEVVGGIMVVRSTDGGRTFSTPTFIHEVPRRVSIGGMPVVDRRGRLYIPYFSGESRASPDTLSVAVSSDGGATFISYPVYQPPGETPAGAYFPALAVGADGVVAAAWWDLRGSILAARSRDGGRTWSRAVRWSGREEAISSPWISIARNGMLDVVWHSRAPSGAVTINLARGTPEGRSIVRGIAGTLRSFSESRPANTDFSHFTRLHDGRVITVWATGTTAADSVAYIAIEKRT
ncbi:MAG: sialidase family protein [Actinomycetota bacterium]